MTTRRPVHRINAGGMSRSPDDLVVEAPLELHLDDTTLAVLMRTPGHDTELAAGWLLVESGTSAPEHIRQLRGCWKNETDAIEITLAAGVEPPRFDAPLQDGVEQLARSDLAPITTSVGRRVPCACIAVTRTTFRRTTSLRDGSSLVTSTNGSLANRSSHSASGFSTRSARGTVMVVRMPRATGNRCGVKTRSASAANDSKVARISPRWRCTLPAP